MGLLKNNNRESSGALKAAFIVTLIFGSILGLFAVFNQHPVLCNLTAYQLQGRSLAFVSFWSFATGVLYTVIVGFVWRLKSLTSGSSKKKNVEEYDDEEDDLI